jgi:hypothetical protein
MEAENVRYYAKQVLLQEDHPFYQKDKMETMYKIWDSQESYLTFTGYTSRDIVDRVVADLNKGIGWIT